MFRTVIVISIYHRYKHISLTCCARSGNVMCFLLGTEKPIELSCVLNKRWIMSRIVVIILECHCHLLTYLLRGLSPQANYTGRATAACRRS
jgi:hypothetical protein